MLWSGIGIAAAVVTWDDDSEGPAWDELLLLLAAGQRGQVHR